MLARLYVLQRSMFPHLLGKSRNFSSQILASFSPNSRPSGVLCSGRCQAQLQRLVGSVLLLLVNHLLLLVEWEGGGQVLLHVRVELLYVQLGLDKEPGNV